MENIKVLVGNTDEYNEAKHLVYELNCDDWRICQDSRGKGSKGFIECEYKQVAIAQLRDMVVLKRNNVVDATHYVQVNNHKYYKGNDRFYFWDEGKWIDSFIENDLKPIQNNDLPFIDSEDDVREFLDYQGGWSYKLITSSVDGCIDRDWIQVPDGACSLTTCDDTLLFWNHDETMCMNPKTESSFRRFNCGGHAEYFKMNSHTMNKLVLWRRNPQKELLNDKVASVEEARQANKTVQDTLDERQKQYGCFEDVAHVTQGMIHLMRKCGYDRMPQTHQMSLYMICSKMARIVNGDFNHVDSWHDISGYAQLVEKLVKDEING